MNDLISIIIPIYKVETYLRDCLVSIQRQRFSNFEVLLINDGSPDNSEEICLDFVKNDYRYKYFYKENEGVSSARNFGIEKATGKWVVFIDSDDTVEESYLKDFVDNFKASNYLLVQDINRITSSGAISNFLNYNDEEINLNDFSKILSNEKYLDGHPVNKFFDLSIIKKNSLSFDEKLTIREDRVFFYKYLEKINTIKFLKTSNYNYFYREGSAVSKKHSFVSYKTYLEYYKKFLTTFFISQNINLENSFINKDYNHILVTSIYRLYKENYSYSKRLHYLKQIIVLKIFPVKSIQSKKINSIFIFFNKRTYLTFDILFKNIIK
ncbi:Glycosyltransferase involved in cell wall bisynthesis [Soonwooa buanensis]|uniref:Glycosyltransferase involved in cell wall bisynthesis n=1 Tax=Soonwooa buanensis TaxID=619805 RepID=A0A1T5EB58_9FLAO|nr:glycosyltransferase family 2 protein [Soonwooa buanensis]SKB81267.1 Glycosyltransferase involved in cell wall bisynthesis [Soonwooa buanensis]